MPVHFIGCVPLCTTAAERAVGSSLLSDRIIATLLVPAVPEPRLTRCVEGIAGDYVGLPALLTPRTPAMRMAMISAMLLFSVGCAEARLTTPAIESVSASPRSGAQLPLALTLKDEAGASRTLEAAIAHTPSILILADYACQALCGPILSLTAGALERGPRLSARRRRPRSAARTPRSEGDEGGADR